MCWVKCVEGKRKKDEMETREETEEFYLKVFIFLFL